MRHWQRQAWVGVVVAVVLMWGGGAKQGWSLDHQPFVKTGKNLAAAGSFDGGAFSKWKVGNNRGAFSAKQVKGRTGDAAALSSTGVKDRGKFFIGGIDAPKGAAIQISVWVKTKNHMGGTWGNLEGKGAKGGQEFFIGGGTHDWLRYEYRTTVAKDGGLSLWFYVYGKGTVMLDDLEVSVITPDTAAEKKWAKARAAALKKDKAVWAGKKPSGLSSIKDLAALVKASASAVSGKKSWGVLATDPVRRVLRDKPFRGTFATAVIVDMARHEFEGSQVLIFAHDKDLKDVSVSISDLKGAGRFSAKNIQVLPVAYGNRSSAPAIPWYNGVSSKDWPDPLLPNRSFTVKSGTVQPVYLRFYCPKDAKPGNYKGTVTIKTSAGTAKIPVALTVHNVTMPVRLNVKSMMVGGKGGSPADKAYLDLALEQRMGNGTLYKGMSWTKHNFPAKGNSFDFSAVEKKLQYAIDRGLNSFAMAGTPKTGKWGFAKNFSAGWKNKMSKMVKEYGKFLKKKGWLKYAYYNNIDEPWSTRWPQVKEIYTMAKKAFPEIQVFSCVNKIGALENLKNHADTFDVYIQHYYQQQSPARQKGARKSGGRCASGRMSIRICLSNIR